MSTWFHLLILSGKMSCQPYFLNGSKNEQNLVQALVNERLLQMYGVEVYYLPRQYGTEKTIIKEVIESKFEHAYPGLEHMSIVMKDLVVGEHSCPSLVLWRKMT